VIAFPRYKLIVVGVGTRNATCMIHHDIMQSSISLYAGYEVITFASKDLFTTFF
jgi:hypothetical protein